MRSSISSQSPRSHSQVSQPNPFPSSVFPLTGRCSLCGEKLSGNVGVHLSVAVVWRPGRETADQERTEDAAVSIGFFFAVAAAK